MALLRECELERYRLNCRLIDRHRHAWASTHRQEIILNKRLRRCTSNSCSQIIFIASDHTLSRAGDKFRPIVLAFDSGCEIESKEVVLSR